MLPRIVQARACPRFVLWVRFDDASEGRVDLSDIAGRGVFKAWDDPAVWSAVRVEPGSRTVTWPGEIDLDPDVLYSDVTGKPLPGYGEPNKAAG